jgi:predicted PurR-regulated permease PerM
MGFTQGPQEALYVALLYLAINQIEGNVIMPVVQKWAVALPPALGILSVVAFGLLFGIPGVLFAVPLMVVVITLVQKLYVEQTVEAKTAA